MPREWLIRFATGTARVRQGELLNHVTPSPKFFPALTPKQPARIPNAPDTPPPVFSELALVKLGPDVDSANALAWLRTQPEIRYVEPNLRLRIIESPARLPGPVPAPNDYEFRRQWALEHHGQSGGTPGADIDMLAAWALSTGSPDVLVAVIDTGIDFFHPDLAGNVWTNFEELAGNGIDDDGNDFIDDFHGYDFVTDDPDPWDDHSHGTHVAGIIGAAGNNGIGIAGVCWQTSMIGLKAFDEFGEGNVASVIAAINYAIHSGARVINASWGSGERSQALFDAIRAATDAGLLFVAAAGNDGNANPFFPADLPDVLAVAATDASDLRASFSNYGPAVAVAAPGDFIRSTIPDDRYTDFSGTSMAAPHVAGLAALILSRHPAFTAAQVASIIRNTTDPVAAEQFIGEGRINAARALAVDAPLPDAELSLPAEIYGVLDLTGTAAGNRFASYRLEYGTGTYPTNWTLVAESNTPVVNGALATAFSTATLAEGDYTFRLSVRSQDGHTATARAFTKVRNVVFQSPRSNDIFRAGDPLELRGRVFGNDIQFAVDYGQGANPTAWLTNGVTLAAGGAGNVFDGPLGSMDTTLLDYGEFYTFRLTVRSGAQLVGQSLARMVFFDRQLRAGWPQHLPVSGTYTGGDWRDVQVADLDHDGRDEIIAMDPGTVEGRAPRVLVFRAEGSLWWSRELTAGAPYTDVPVIGDLDGDGQLEVLADTGPRGPLFAFHTDGSPLGGLWPAPLPAAGLGKVIADLDGDGRPEVIGLSQFAVRKQGKEYRQLVVYDANGALRQSWDIPDCPAAREAPRILPAVGNLDDAPDLEIVVPYACNEVAAFSLKQPDGPLWHTRTSGQFLSSPVIGDIDDDHHNNVVIASAGSDFANTGGLYVFNHRGEVRRGWPVLLEEEFRTPPALADLDGDRRMEISIAAWNSRRIHLVRPDGFEPPGWPVGPVFTSVVRSATMIGDVDGDGQPEVVMASPGFLNTLVQTGNLDSAGGVLAWNRDGVDVDVGPFDHLFGLLMESPGSNSKLPVAPVTLADLDHNGQLNIIAASTEDRAFSSTAPLVTRKLRRSLYVWDLPRPFNAAAAQWPAFQRGPSHPGNLVLASPANHPPVIESIPDQIIAPGGRFFPIALDQYARDPDQPARELSWRVEGARNLQVVINASHVALVLPPNDQWTGAETLRFIVTDAGGLEAGASAQFTVQTGYQSPVPGLDTVTTAEDTPVEIDALANDTDPTGATLHVARVSRPPSGAAAVTPRGTIRYTPARNFFGEDAFDYTVLTDRGGMAMGEVHVTVTPVNDPPEAGLVRALVDEDQPLVLDPLATSTEPDREPITLVNFDPPAHGVASLDAQGELHYLPATNFNGSDAITFVIADPTGLRSTNQIQILVKPVYDPPVAHDANYVLNRNSTLTVGYAVDNPDGGELSFKITGPPLHAELFQFPKVITYAPAKGFAGEDSFTFTASDGRTESNPAVARFTVLPANNPPVGDEQSLVTLVNQPVLVTLTATDLDEDPLAFAVAQPPAHGTVEGVDTNQLYRPAPGYFGEDAFTFTANDGQADSGAARISLFVTTTNTPPVAHDVYVETPRNKSATIKLDATDGESTPLTFRIVTNVIEGTLELQGADALYTPPSGFTGYDRFSYTASDGVFESDPATVYITIRHPNKPPTATNQFVVTTRNTAVTFTLAAQDRDGDALQGVIVKGPRHGRVFGAGVSYTFTPQFEYTGNDLLTYRVWDGHAYSKEGKVTFIVTTGGGSSPLEFASVLPTERGQITLVLRAVAGRELEVQASINLVDWTALGRLTPMATLTTFTDTNAPAHTARFYRLMQTQ